MAGCVRDAPVEEMVSVSAERMRGTYQTGDYATQAACMAAPHEGTGVGRGRTEGRLRWLQWSEQPGRRRHRAGMTA